MDPRPHQGLKAHFARTVRMMVDQHYLSLCRHLQVGMPPRAVAKASGYSFQHTGTRKGARHPECDPAGRCLAPKRRFGSYPSKCAVQHRELEVILGKDQVLLLELAFSSLPSDAQLA